jgi:hypothetical protein
MIRNEKCEVSDKQNFEPKYRMVYDNVSLITNEWSSVRLTSEEISFVTEVQ